MSLALLGVLARWSQLLAAVALVGITTLLLLAGRSDRPTAQAWEARMLAWTRALAAFALVAGVLGLVWQAAHLSGRPIDAIEWTALRRVLLETQAGHVWLARHGLILLLAAFTALRLATETAADWVAARAEAAVLATAALVLVAASGHAAGLKPGALGAMVNDGVHLLGAGVWVGALLPLAALLRTAGREGGADARPHAVLAARRFSRLALVALLVLGVSGVWNAAMYVGSLAALLGTVYGRLLLVKLALLVPIVCLAVVNRRRLLPALSGAADTVGRPAMRRLAGFVVAEAALAAAVLAVAAAMATTPPARHETPVWPFPVRLTFDALPSVAALGLRGLIGSQIAVLGLVALVAALVVSRRRFVLGVGAVMLLATGLALFVPPLVVEAFPTTYARPRVPYTAASLMRGRALFRAHCAACHGASGTGDREARTPAGAQSNLGSPRLDRRTAGDLYWLLTHGLPRQGMPGVGDRLGEEARWDLVNYLRALSAAAAARGMGPTVEPGRAWLVAPDFTFGVGPMPPRALRDHRGTRLVLLVLYSLPASRPRLEQLAQQYELLVVLDAEVIAVPRDADPHAIRRLGAEPKVLFPIVTEGAEEIVAAYDLLGGGPPHAEFLIDRQGFIRARWIAGAETRRDMNLLLAEIQQLNEEKAPTVEAAEHVH